MYLIHIRFYKPTHREFFECMYIEQTKGVIIDKPSDTSVKIAFTNIKDALDFYMLFKVDVFICNMLRIVKISDIVTEEN